MKQKEEPKADATTQAATNRLKLKKRNRDDAQAIFHANPVQGGSDYTRQWH